MWLLFVVFLWINRLSKGKGILHLLKILSNMAKSFYFNEKHVKKAFLKNALSLIVFTHVAHKMYCLIVLMFAVLETRSFLYFWKHTNQNSMNFRFTAHRINNLAPSCTFF